MKRASAHWPIPGGAGTGLGQRLVDRRDEAAGQHEVAQAEGGQQQLREAADVDHPAAAIEGAQGRERAPGIAVGAVVIVLHDPARDRLGPGQEVEAVLQAHGVPEG